VPELPRNHLSEEELQDYADGAGLPAAVQSHLEVCSGCRSRAGDLRNQQLRIDALRSTETEAAGPGCPEPTAWLTVLRGILPQDEAANLLAHAAVCSPCAQRLRETAEDLATEPNPHDPLLSSLPSSLPGGMQAQAQKFAQAAGARQGRPFARDVWVWAAAAAVIIGAVSGAIVIVRPTPARVNGLLAQAYEQRRWSELRFPDARYAPVRQQRGEAAVPTEAWLEAGDVISKELNRHPDDARWLQASGRAKIIGRMFDGAIADLTKAAAVLPGDASIRADLGAAYFERGQARDDVADFRSSLDFFSQAIERNPRRPALRFNRAVVLEHLSMYGRAESEWDEFLKLEPAGGWADEARARQAQLRKNLAH